MDCIRGAREIVSASVLGLTLILNKVYCETRVALETKPLIYW